MSTLQRILTSPLRGPAMALTGGVCGLLGFACVGAAYWLPGAGWAGIVGMSLIFIMATVGTVGIKWRAERGLWMLAALFVLFVLVFSALALFSTGLDVVGNPAKFWPQLWQLPLFMTPWLFAGWIAATCGLANYRRFRGGGDDQPMPPPETTPVPAKLGPGPKGKSAAAVPELVT